MAEPAPGLKNVYSPKLIECAVLSDEARDAASSVVKSG
jgi:hypothetical protein